MKRISLLILACTSAINAEISYKGLYAETAAVAGGIVLASYGLSRLCYHSESSTWVLAMGTALATASGLGYYKWMHPESRMSRNTHSFQSSWDSALFRLIKDQTVSTNSLMRKIASYYVEVRNPFYTAFEDILSLKNNLALLNMNQDFFCVFTSLSAIKMNLTAKP